jgi:hypothetical protein
MEGLSSIACYPYKYIKLCGRAFSFFGRNEHSSGEVHENAALALALRFGFGFGFGFGHKKKPLRRWG